MKYSIFTEAQLDKAIAYKNLEQVTKLVDSARSFFPSCSHAVSLYNKGVSILWQYYDNVPGVILRDNRGFHYSFAEYVSNGNILYTAISGQDRQIIDFLLSMPEVRKRAHAQGNRCLHHAINTKDHISALALCRLPNVQNELHMYDNIVLLRVIEWGDFELFKEIVDIPTISQFIHSNNNLMLYTAAKYRKFEIFKYLLEIPEVINSLHENWHRILQTARSNLDTKITGALLAIPWIGNHEREYQNLVTRQETVETHTSSIHGSVSASALRLKAKNLAVPQSGDNAASTANPVEKCAEDKLPVNINVLKDNIIKTCIDNEVQFYKLIDFLHSNIRRKDTSIIESITAAYDFIHHNQDHQQENFFMDPVSELSLPDLLQCILVEISKIADTELKLNAQLQLGACLYSAHNEYGIGRNACCSGYFNALIYSQASIFDEISVVIQTPADCTIMLQHKLEACVIKLFETNNFHTAAALEAAVLQEAKINHIGHEICRSLMRDFYYVFSLPNEMAALSFTVDEVAVQCFEKFKCTPVELFEMLNYEVIFAQQQEIRSNAEQIYASNVCRAFRCLWR